jgi:hypothetical protein
MYGLFTAQASIRRTPCGDWTGSGERKETALASRPHEPAPRPAPLETTARVYETRGKVPLAWGKVHETRGNELETRVNAFETRGNAFLTRGNANRLCGWWR